MLSETDRGVKLDFVAVDAERGGVYVVFAERRLVGLQPFAAVVIAFGGDLSVCHRGVRPMDRLLCSCFQFCAQTQCLVHCPFSVDMLFGGTLCLETD